MPILLRRSKSSNKFLPSNDEPKENSLIERSILEWAFNHQFKSGGRFTLPTTPSIKFGGSFSPSDHPEHRIWGVIFPFRPPRASNLGGRFTLPTTPSIESGGHFRLSGSSEVKFGAHSCIIDLSDTLIWAHSCITDLSDTLIWGSFLHHRPVRASNLGVKIRGSKRGGVRFFPFFKNFSPITFPPTKKTEGLRRSVFSFFLTSNLSRSARL